MYTIQTKASFDSAHFLKGYDGKCSNLHGHRWTVEVELAAEELQSEGQCRGMVMDFSDVKEALRAEAKRLDHSLLIEKDSLKPATMAALKDENFKIEEFPFRPTAENFAKYFYDFMKDKGFPVSRVWVYETPNNRASYAE